ncbi:MAG: hypothetical protein ABSH19_10105 [Opitutales bacterium]
MRASPPTPSSPHPSPRPPRRLSSKAAPGAWPTGSGTILAVVAGGGTVGAVTAIDMPAVNGITVVNVASGPAFTVGYS